METSRWAPSEQAPLGGQNDTATPFAQTGGEANDLFADDFTPIAQPVSQAVPPEAPSSSIPQFRHPRGDRNARRAQGRGRGGRAVPPPIPLTGQDDDALLLQQKESEIEEPSAETSDQVVKSTGPSAVRGDRRQTGGILRPRLTEEELSAKLEAAKLNNAKREEAHRAAEADEASFRAQEHEAQERRKEEAVNRKKMEAERERNRARKLAGRGGREWDEGKDEHSGQGKGRGYRRGTHAAAPEALMRSLPDKHDTGHARWTTSDCDPRSGDPKDDYRPREGHGGRGRLRGRGRAGHELRRPGGRGQPPSSPPVLGEANFPALSDSRSSPKQSSDFTQESKEILGSSVKPSETEPVDAQNLLEAPSTAIRSRHSRSPWRVTDEPKTSWAEEVEENI